MSKPISAKDFVDSSADTREVTGTTLPDPNNPGKEKRYLDTLIANSIILSSSAGVVSEVISPGVANTEFSVTLPEGTKQFHLRPDTTPRWEYSYISGGTFMKVGLGGVLERLQLNIPVGGLSIFLKCVKASESFKLEVWT